MTTEITTNSTLKSTKCAICDTLNNATELHSANFDFEHFNADIFSARRLPDQIHYRMVRCNACGLVRSDPVIADNSFLNQLYKESRFTYGDEINNLKQTYGRYLKHVPVISKEEKVLIEVGGGNGFFLTQALEQGYTRVYNVEPSHDAVQQASPNLANAMICDIFRDGLFEPESIDTICFFQVFDHLPNPVEALQICYKILKPGGCILFLNHNVQALSAKLLGKRSPIIDIEHTYLYDTTTLSRLVEQEGFSVYEVGVAKNLYSLNYVARLLYMPKSIKQFVLGFIAKTPLKNIKASFPLGNLYLIAQKPRN